MEDESSLTEPSESSSFPIEHATNVDDAPDSEIETAPESPDSLKVGRYIHPNMLYHLIKILPR